LEFFDPTGSLGRRAASDRLAAAFGSKKPDEKSMRIPQKKTAILQI
jgi:hypothetical protein